MSDRESPSAGDVIGRNYLIERALGEGGMGTVFLARHTVTGRRVALKWMSTVNAVHRERMLREARSMGRLAHPNVVGVLDAGEHEGAVFTVMEYADGDNLRSYAAGRTLTHREAIDLLMPAFAGVAAAHQAGILHRDLKPENLFVCTNRDGTAFDTKVLDFGVAKSLDDTEVSLTSSGTIIGTPKYMAPEQILNGDDLDVRADVYALALILYELIAGKLPYKTSGLKALVVEILAGKIPHLRDMRSGLPDGLCNVVMKALSTEREFRYADVSEFALALEPFAGIRRFEPPRQMHTPEATVDEVMSPELRAIAQRTEPHLVVMKGPEITTKPSLRARAAPRTNPTPVLNPAIEISESSIPPVKRSSRGVMLVAALTVSAIVAIIGLTMHDDEPKPPSDHVSQPMAAATPSDVPKPPSEPAAPVVAAPIVPSIVPDMPSHEPAAVVRDAAQASADVKAAEPAAQKPRTHHHVVAPKPEIVAPATDKSVKVRGGTLKAKDF